MRRVPEDIRRRIEAIAFDRLSGARELAGRAAATLALTARVQPEDVPQVAQALIEAQPAMAPMVNLARRAMAASDVEAACREFLEEIDRAAARVAALAAGLIRDAMTVLTHSSSATVFGAFRTAREAGRGFAVIATESRPQREGVGMAERVGALGIPVTLIVDAAVYRFLPRAQMAFVGADSVSPRGLVNKTGTSLVALAASKLGVPVYALCGSEKFLPEFYEPPPEQARDRGEILECELPNTTAENYYFDTTPLDYLTGIVTEDGVLRPPWGRTLR
jgi:translation initiation factor 2B subunit (eIF-2B alpha/beta/delta family)